MTGCLEKCSHLLRLVARDLPPLAENKMETSYTDTTQWFIFKLLESKLFCVSFCHRFGPKTAGHMLTADFQFLNVARKYIMRNFELSVFFYATLLPLINMHLQHCQVNYENCQLSHALQINVLSQVHRSDPIAWH